MNTMTLCAGAALALALTPGIAQAAEPLAIDVQASAGVSSDYIYRGVSQTMEDPQVYAAVDLAIGTIGYAGVWTSNIDFGDGTDAEIDVYGGIRPKLGNVTFDLGLIYAAYLGQPDGTHGNFFEAKIAASTAVGPATFGASVNYSPAFYDKTGEAFFYEITGSVPIEGTGLTIGGAVGRQTVDKSPSYTTWNAGASYQLKKLSLDLRYYDTKGDKFGNISKARVVAGAKLTY